MAHHSATLYLFAAITGYLLGSFPTGYLIARLRGIDIRQHGSGNIGATNVVRVLGKKIGAVVFVCDALKGWLAVNLGEAMLALIAGAPSHAEAASSFVPEIGGIIGALACILGHNFPVWLGFHGGKGIATTFGAILGLMPFALLIAAVVWFALFFTLRYVSVASLAAAATLPVTMTVLWSQHRANPALIWFSAAAAALAVWRHRANLQRLRVGTEPRFSRKPKATSPVR